MSTNEELNKLPIYINKVCECCGRSYPETILNIEGVIHHKTNYLCIDRKECERIKKRL
jgi:hypothetical protein